MFFYFLESIVIFYKKTSVCPVYWTDTVIYFKCERELTSLTESSYYKTAARKTFKLRKRNRCILFVDGNKATVAEFFKVTLTVANENAELADVYVRSLFNKQNITVMIFRLHGVTGNAESKIGALGFFVGNAKFLVGGQWVISTVWWQGG